MGLLLTHSVSPQQLKHFTLRYGLKGGSSQHAVDSLPKERGAALLPGRLPGQLGQGFIICVWHAGKTHTKPAHTPQLQLSYACSSIKDNQTTVIAAHSATLQNRSEHSQHNRRTKSLTSRRFWIIYSDLWVQWTFFHLYWYYSSKLETLCCDDNHSDHVGSNESKIAVMNINHGLHNNLL